MRLLILLIPALAVSYYFAEALPANQRATLDFEKQKYEAENAAKEKKEADAIIESVGLKSQFNVCRSCQYGLLA
jgi:hypothetical protein